MTHCIGAVMIAMLAAGAQPPSKSMEDANAMREAAKSVNSFGVRLYSKIRHVEGNVAVSPVSVETLMALLAAGADEPTADRLAEVSGLPAESIRAGGGFVRLLDDLATRNDAEQGVALDSAVSVWVEPRVNVRRAYSLIVQRSYAGKIEQVDFAGEPEAARRRINGWVAEHTRGEVPELIPAEVSLAETRLLLSSAVSFRAAWESPFSRDKTRPAPFRVTASRIINVPMMRQVVEIRSAMIDDAQIVELPYRGGTLTMVVILPRRDHGLLDLEQRIERHGIEPWLRALPDERIESEVFLPRFEVDDGRELNGPLQALGLGVLFGDQARLSGLSEPAQAVDRVLTRTRVRVDEEGTIAAAATAGFEGRSDPIPFRADHPFIYLIRETRTGTIIFLGRLVEPESKPG